MFNRLYQHYKDSFDLEMRLKKSNTTYDELHKKQLKSEEWL